MVVALGQSVMRCVCKKFDDYWYGDEQWSEINDNDDDADSVYAIVSRMFPGARFIVSMSLAELREPITHLDKIIVKQTFDCYCYCDGYGELRNAPVPRWFPIHRRDDEYMTNELIIKELVRQGMSLDCNHCFLEGFVKSPNGGECQFELVTGS